MLAIGLLMMNSIPACPLPVHLIGEILLWIAACLTIITGYDYCRLGLKHIR
jgi:phosphatidylglycerophosphate synthase